MKKKIAYAVFTKTLTDKEYMVKGNFGTDKQKADNWKEQHENVATYPNGLFVKEVKY